MKFLIDTNVLIAGEPTDAQNVEPATGAVARLVGAVLAHGGELYCHPDSLVELGSDRDPARRELRQTLVAKYPSLPAPPAIGQALIEELGPLVPGSNHEIDAKMLAAVAGDAVDFLVTSDLGIHRRAKRVGLEQRVVSVSDALFLLRELAAEAPLEFPAVSKIFCHELDHTAPFFDSLRAGYDGFDDWIKQAKREHRPAYRIEVGGRLAGLALLKEDDNEPLAGSSGRLLKLCTMKIADEFRGNRYGELILKPVFEHCRVGGFDAVFCTCFPKEKELVSHLSRFGFELVGRKGQELVLVKRFKPTDHERQELDPLAYHVRFGPYRVKAAGAAAFVVPVQPRWHEQLFPELEEQMGLFAGQTPYGNSIRKAYLCRSMTKTIEPGSVLLFYRSQDRSCVQAVGIAEASVRSREPIEIIRYVGTRTVYSEAEVEAMAAESNQGVLAVLFRQAQSIDNTPLLELVRAGVLKGAPQSITKVRTPKGIEWIRSRVET
ncbi:GNAT family N-acetyltransferase [Botrimarina mediterranea]|uniref:N-acetyltransferase domain-containing protein n=1 Tax=Botrimarina mediterranea TaxID=2528022 RepID=A0A518K620_9BACT|nr:GNAT family N-acetyltransferase [Botrimarina mediterranea]QDV73240.1 hypothetical protein Spa11_14360 [Botrimarina mediterranea]